MKINYNDILEKNMINVFADILKRIEKKGLTEGHHLYVTFETKNQKIIMSDWLKKKFTDFMTIVIQYEYWNFKVLKNSFKITLSFNNMKENLEIPFESVVSFTDPYANFGLKLKNVETEKNKKKKKKKKREDKSYKNNIIKFDRFKKN